jgi:hypothetical protein
MPTAIQQQRQQQQKCQHQHIKCQNKLDVSIKIKTTIILAYVNKVWTTFREDKLKCQEKWILKKDQRERRKSQKLRERERER